MLKKLYLLGYNGALCAGWGAIFVKVAMHLAKGGSFETVYPLIRDLLVVCQSAAFMEVLHAMLKLVRSPVGTTFIQVLSRLVVLWGALEIGSGAVTTNYFATQMIIAWSLSEIVRYSFYFVGLLDKDKVPALMSWVRYSAFAVLYPVGITGEIMCLYNALPFVKANGTYSTAMPNKMNFAFDYHGMIWFTLLGIYPYGSYVMYSYMLNQRKKVLGKKKAQ